MAELKFEVTQNCGVISESAKGWKKELNFVSWNGREAKLDLREWDLEHLKMGKGITLTNEEAKKLREILNDLEL